MLIENKNDTPLTIVLVLKSKKDKWKIQIYIWLLKGKFELVTNEYYIEREKP